MNIEEATAAVQNALAEGVKAVKQAHGDEAGAEGVMVLQWVSLYTFIDGTGEKKFGWSYTPDMRTYEIRGLLDEMRSDLDAREVASQLQQLAEQAYGYLEEDEDLDED